MIQRAITWKITADVFAALALLSQKMIDFCKHRPFVNGPTVMAGGPSVSRFELKALLLVEIDHYSLTAVLPLIGKSSCSVSLNTLSDVRPRTNSKFGMLLRSVCQPADISSLKRLVLVDLVPVLVAGELNHGGSFIS